MSSVGGNAGPSVGADGPVAVDDDMCDCVLYVGRHEKQGGRCPQYAMGRAYAKWTKATRRQG